MDRLRESLNSVLDTVCPGRLPDNQPKATAISMLLAWELCQGIESSGHPLRLHGAPHSPLTRELAAEHELEFERNEFMLDFCVFEEHSKNVLLPLLGCESEVHDTHGVKYQLDSWNAGYVWDFRKLIHYRAPHLLFIGRLNRASQQIPELEMTLSAFAADYSRVWRDARLNIVLIPSGITQRELVRLGVGEHGNALRFESLDHSVPHYSSAVAS